LGNFGKAVASHEQVRLTPDCSFFIESVNKPGYSRTFLFQRLLIAKEFGDRSAERRAYCNLGNAYIFLGEFEVAAEHYK